MNKDHIGDRENGNLVLVKYYYAQWTKELTQKNHRHGSKPEPTSNTDLNTFSKSFSSS